MKRRFTLQEANRSLPLVSRIVADIVAAHNAATQLQSRLESSPSAASPKDNATLEAQLEAKLERLQWLVDELTDVGVELKDYSMGLVDFVGRHQGRDVYLCWKLGERQIAYWHELHAGFAGRQPVATLREAGA